MLFLRTISLEYAAKRKGVIQREMLADAVGDAADPQWREHSAILTEGMELFLRREGPFLLEFSRLCRRTITGVSTPLGFEFRKLFLSQSLLVCPWLNDYYDKWSPGQPQAMVSISVIPAVNHTDIVSSWLDYCNEDAKWIQKEMETFEGAQRMVNLLGMA